MTRVSDLPINLQEVLFGLGYWRGDEIIPTIANPALGDKPHDGQVSFYIASTKGVAVGDVRGLAGYYMIGAGPENSPTKDCLFYSPPDVAFIRSVLVIPDISQWAEQIDPRSGSGRPAAIQWPDSIANAEAIEALAAQKGLEQATWTTPKGVYSDGAADEFSRLPIGHPAKDFVEETLREYGAEIKKVEQMSADIKTPQTAPDVYNKYTPTLVAMKSVKALYEAGWAIWDDFPHLREKPQISLLYPGSGYHVGALCMAMALIDRGANAVDAIFTEINGKAVDDGFEILAQWIKSNPDLRGNLTKHEEKAEMVGGMRLFTEFLYKGKKIRLNFAWNDSPQDMFFNPADFIQSDVILIHDTTETADKTESLLLKQALPLLRPDIPPKAIVMTNELDMHPFRLDEGDSPWSVLPIRGRRIAGSFGHGGGFPVRNGAVGVTWWSMPEMGAAYHQSALIFSTHAPLLQNLQDPEDANTFVDFALVAGSRNFVKPRDPGSSGDFNFTIWSRKEIGETDPQKLLKWCAQNISHLPPDDQHYFALIAARLVAQWEQDERYRQHKPGHSLIPKELAPYVAQALAKERLIPSSQVANLKKLNRFGQKRIRQLDGILLKLQNL